MRKKILFVVALLLPLMLVAGVDNRVAQMRTKIKELKNYSIEFSTIDNDGNVLIDGRLTVGNNEKYHLKTKLGEVWFDGENVWNYSSENNEVTVDRVENQNNILANPQKLLALDCEDENQIESVAQNDEEVDGVEMWVSKVLLKNDGANFEILLSINKKTGLPSVLKVSSEEGDYTFTIKVKKIETNIKVKESDFKFDSKKYSDVEIIDFR
ncbi:MAG: outer membrane lipoprotein carrier protein LolA [Rikenellaceae bacterium]|nr:outer membrane lipoprotein carrier protein LolA [Rikenellaceae bacterium]